MKQVAPFKTKLVKRLHSTPPVHINQPFRTAVTRFHAMLSKLEIEYLLMVPGLYHKFQETVCGTVTVASSK